MTIREATAKIMLAIMEERAGTAKLRGPDEWEDYLYEIISNAAEEYHDLAVSEY